MMYSPIYSHYNNYMKNRTTAALLALFLGGLGVHHFYLGNALRGVLYLLFWWTWIPVIIAFVESLILFSMKDSEFDRKYNYEMR